MNTEWTVKAIMQERETERGTEVMWFHTGNYTEMMQEATINGSFPAATLCNSIAIFRRPGSLFLKNRSKDVYVFPLESVNRFALTEVNIVKRNS